MVKYDRPDYSPEKTEVALRPTLIYPSGRVIVIDDFESPSIKWVKSGDAGSLLTLATNETYEGSGALKLNTGTVADYEIRARRWVGLTDSKRVGIQFAFCATPFQTTTMQIQLEYYDGSTVNFANVRHTFATGKWEYESTAGTWTTITGFTTKLAYGAHRWNFMKLIIDFSTNKFVWLYVNETNINLSDYSAYASGGTSNKALRINLHAYGNSATQKPLYVDNVVVTEE